MAYTHEYVGLRRLPDWFADYLYGRRGRKKCDVCGKKFDNVIDMEGRDLHPVAVTG